MNAAMNLVSVFKESVLKAGTGVTFYQKGEDVHRYTYYEIYHKALTALGMLQHHGFKKDDELIIQIEENRYFLVIFWACILGGMRPVPLSTGSSADICRKLNLIWKVLGNPGFICDDLVYGKMQKEGSLGDGEYIRFSPERILPLSTVLDFTVNGMETLPGEDDIAYIQFSSGSTGDPKGITLTHRNLVANIGDITTSLKIDRNDILLNWMPLTHDMAMIGFHLVGMANGINCVSVQTDAFIRNPRLWMTLCSLHRTSVLYSPNFGLQYFLRSLAKAEVVDWDLSCIRLIVNGAESISAQLCDQFCGTLAQYGLKRQTIVAAYGLAEASVEVSAMPAGEAIRVHFLNRKSLVVGKQVHFSHEHNIDCVALVDVGFPVNSCRVRICDEHDATLGEDMVGHIQIKGVNVTRGYYNNEDKTRQLFTADLWLRTGDLGFFHQQRLVITGRSKEIVIINGINIYPNDIEGVLVANGCGVLGKIVAVGYKNKQTQQEELIIFVGFRSSEGDFKMLQSSIRQFLLLNIGISVAHIIEVKKIPRTTSGKIRRFALIQEFEEQYNSLYNSALNADAAMGIMSSGKPGILKAEINHIIEELLGAGTITAGMNLIEAGLNSIAAVQLSSRIDALTGCRIPVNFFFTNPSVDQIVSYLSADSGAAHFNDIEKDDLVAHHSACSYAQTRIWYETQLNNTSAAYNICIRYQIDGKLDLTILVRAFTELVRKYEILRTSFHFSDDSILRKVHPFTDSLVALQHINLQDEECNVYCVKKLVHRLINTAIPLDEPCQFRIISAEYDDCTFQLFLVIHHILVDGWSLKLLMAELVFVYNCLKCSADVPVQKSPIQYSAYVHWQKNIMRSTTMKIQEEYWLAELKNLPEPASLNRFKNAAKPQVAKKAKRLKYWFSEAEYQYLKKLALQFKTTVPCLCLSFVNVLICRYTGLSEILIGFEINGRVTEKIESIIGYTLNLVLVRNNVENADTMAQVINKVRNKIWKALDNQLYPFEKIIENEAVFTQAHGKVPFDILLLYQSFGNTIKSEEFAGCRSEVTQVYSNQSFTDLVLEFSEENETFSLLTHYNTSAYKRQEISQFVTHFKKLISLVFLDCSHQVGMLDILTNNEKKFLLPEIEQSYQLKHFRLPVHLLFERMVKLHPENIAIVVDDRELSYFELNRMANALANCLKERYTVKPDDKIGFLVERSEHVVIAMLAIMKAGGCFIGIDPEYPVLRRNGIIIESNIICIVTDDCFENELRDFWGSELIVNIDQGRLGRYSLSNPLFEGTMNQLAYVIFTSGSSGKPKGVLIEHGSLLDYVRHFIKYFDVFSIDIFIQQATVAFDTIIEEVFPALCTAARIVISKTGSKDIGHLLSLITAHKVTILSTIPLVLNEINRITDSRIASLRIVISGGDVLHASYINNLFLNVPVYNTYGPTEATVCTTYKKIMSLSDCRLIGEPITGRSVYLLDQNLNLLPPGKTGEIYIEGGLARGYLNMIPETEQKFIKNPFNQTKKLYRTGDLAKWTRNRELKFEGRIDNEVKIRGVRIDLNGIEQVILTSELVEEVSVVSTKGIEDGEHIVAYISGGDPLCVKNLKTFLRERLPVSFLPSEYIQINKMPVMANGKIDRNSLGYRAATDIRTVVKADNILPQTNMETELLEIWEELLNKKGFGTEDNFFEIGGHSLLANRLVNTIYAAFGITLKFVDVFSYPTIRNLAELIDGKIQHKFKYINID